MAKLPFRLRAECRCEIVACMSVDFAKIPLSWVSFLAADILQYMRWGKFADAVRILYDLISDLFNNRQKAVMMSVRLPWGWVCLSCYGRRAALCDE